MGGRRHRKREQSSKRKNRNSRAKGAQSEYRLLQVSGHKATGDKATAIVAYDVEFARLQVLLYSHTCVVCRKRNYFMKACSRCKLAKYCSSECLRKHCSLDEQRFKCVNNLIFSTARKLIPPQVEETIFKSGYHEISPHIYSIPRREVYQLMDGTRSVILLQVVSAQIVNTLLHVTVQDIDGLLTVLLFHPPEDAQRWFLEVMKSIPPQTFILVLNCFWNNHADRHSAAVEVISFHPLEQTQEIKKLLRQKDYNIISRAYQKLNT